MGLRRLVQVTQRDGWSHPLRTLKNFESSGFESTEENASFLRRAVLFIYLLLLLLLLFL